MTKKLLFLSTLLASQVLFAQSNSQDTFTSKTFLKSFSYEERVYSQERKSELGDQTRLKLGLQYQYSEDTYAGFRFQSLPSFNLDAFEADRFEITFGHRYNDLTMALDLDLLTDAGADGGAMTIAIDQDSDGTFIKWDSTSKLDITFFPFNFNTRIGNYFETWDITRIYIIEGSPSVVSQTANAAANERIIEKTIPGIVFDYSFTNSLSAYLGMGMSTFLYPTNDDFDLINNPNATSWERLVDYGFKVGLDFEGENNRSYFRYATHTNSEKTGSLLESGGSIYTLQKIGSRFIADLELTYTKAGKSPYRLNRTRDWFVDEAPFRPVFSDFFGNEVQDWVGKDGYGTSLRLGYEFDKFTPYVVARWHSEYLLFNRLESAHLLRTKDLTESHGGMTRFGIGSYFYNGKFSFNPEVEYRVAKNPVFTNASDVPADRILGSFKKSDLLFSFFVNYSFDGLNDFQL